MHFATGLPMMLRSFLLGIGSVVTMGVLAVACGSNSDDGSNGNGDGGAGNGNGNGDNGGFVDGGNNTNPTSVSPDAACATSSAAGEGIAASLIFMFDRSGSMKQDNKWTAASAAMKGFFADPNSASFNASLQFFPLYDANNDLQCTPPAYKAPAVPLTQLPNGPLFGSAIDGIGFGENTPTLPALQGALQYAADVQAGGKKAAVVMVTDGEPVACTDQGNTIDNVAAAAAAVAGTVKTYVIGVGSSLQNLDAIAAAGGTNKAILVDTSTSADQLTTQISTAIGAIASQAVSCDYKIPPPPAGQSIDPNKVNVQSKGSTLSYDAQCASGTGWHYDDPNAPTKIILCPTTCNEVLADKSAQINVFFGCAVQGGIPR